MEPPMSRGREILEKISTDLSRGSASMALLGTQASEELHLDSHDGLARYADMIRPSIAAALRSNRTTEWLLYVLLVALFATATTLAILGNLQKWSWIPSATAIPGLGVTAPWPIRILMRLRQQNLKLSVVPDLLPLLQPKDAAGIVKELLLKVA